MALQAQFPYEKYKLYVVHHKKMNRKMACLVNPSIRNDRKTISYARYVMSVFLGRELTKEETVDHIDEDKTNDSLENLRILSRLDNQKSYVENRRVIKTCPVCAKKFSIGKKSRLEASFNTCSNSCKYTYLSKEFQSNSRPL